MVSNEAQPHSNGARNERGPKNQRENDEVHALHVPHFPLFLFLRPGALLDDPKPHDDPADAHCKRGPLSKDEEQPAIAVSSEDEDEDKPERKNFPRRKESIEI